MTALFTTYTSLPDPKFPVVCSRAFSYLDFLSILHFGTAISTEKRRRIPMDGATHRWMATWMEQLIDGWQHEEFEKKSWSSI